MFLFQVSHLILGHSCIKNADDTNWGGEGVVDRLAGRTVIVGHLFRLQKQTGSGTSTCSTKANTKSWPCGTPWLNEKIVSRVYGIIPSCSVQVISRLQKLPCHFLSKTNITHLLCYVKLQVAGNLADVFTELSYFKTLHT